MADWLYESNSSRCEFGFRLRNDLSLLRSYGLMRTHRARRFGIGLDGFKSNISIQIRPYDSSSYKSFAGPSPILTIDGSQVQVLVGPSLTSCEPCRYSGKSPLP